MERMAARHKADVNAHLAVWESIRPAPLLMNLRALILTGPCGCSNICGSAPQEKDTNLLSGCQRGLHCWRTMH